MSRSYVGREDIPPPRPVLALFVCDGDHGLFGPPDLRPELRPGGAFAWDLAVAAGWTITPERDLCPECSGKRPRDAAETLRW